MQTARARGGGALTAIAGEARPTSCHGIRCSLVPAPRLVLQLAPVDGHGSRLHPDCIEKAEEIGFDVLIYPGGMTAVLQLMDQVFGPIKRDYTQRMAYARAHSSGRSLNLQGRIRVWCEAKRAFVEQGGPARLKSAARTLGLYPVSMEQCLANLAARTSAPKTAAAVAGGDVAVLADKTVAVVGLKRRRVSDITEAADGEHDDCLTDGDEAEDDSEAAPAKRRATA